MVVVYFLPNSVTIQRNLDLPFIHQGASGPAFFPSSNHSGWGNVITLRAAALRAPEGPLSPDSGGINSHLQLVFCVTNSLTEVTAAEGGLIGGTGGERDATRHYGKLPNRKVGY